MKRGAGNLALVILTYSSMVRVTLGCGIVGDAVHVVKFLEDDRSL
jgi:hypothetical protein